MLKTLLLLAASFTWALALNTLELNINNNDLELGASIDISQLNDAVEADTVYLGFKLLSADGKNSDLSSSQIENYYEVSFLMKRDYNHNLEIGLGMKLNGTKNFATVPLGAEARYSLGTELPVYIGGSFYYAPRVLSMSDAKNFMEYRVYADIEIIENAMITIGYRSLDTNYDKPIEKNFSYNSSLYAGFKFKF